MSLDVAREQELTELTAVVVSRKLTSRAPLYETVEEELSSSTPSSPAQPLNDGPTCQPVFTVNSDAASVHSLARSDEATWGDEHGIVALKTFYTLRDEAVKTVTSKHMWKDMPFSLFTVQCACSLSTCIRCTN